MKHLIASVSIAAITALSAGAVTAQTTTTTASTPTTAAAQGGRDQAVYRDKNGMRVRKGASGAVLDPNGLTIEEIDAFGKTDSAFESEEYRALAYPDGRGSKNYAAVQPTTGDNGADPVTTSSAQGGRDGAVYRDKNGMMVRAGTPGAVFDPQGWTVEELEAAEKTDSAFESAEFRALAYPDGRGSKNYAAVQPVASGNGADPVTTAAAQGGRDAAVYRDKDGMMVRAGTPGSVVDPQGWTVEELEAAEKTDSAFESAEFRALAYPDGRGSKNYAAVQPVASGNGADAVTTSAAQGGRDEAVYKDEESTTTATD